MAEHSSRAAQIDQLHEKGYVLIPRFVPAKELRALNEAARVQLAARAPPIEFEADLQYPGAPSSRSAVGGETVRRLLDACARDPVFARCGTAHALRDWMQANGLKDDISLTEFCRLEHHEEDRVAFLNSVKRAKKENK